MTGYACTPSPNRPTNSASKSDQQPSEAYTTPPFTYASSSTPNLHSLIRNSQREGITILKFIYGQLYNNKLALR
jgi:hypothetical protein